MKAIEQAAQECAAVILHWYSSPHKDSPSAKEECSNVIAAAMRKVCEPLEKRCNERREVAQAILVRAERAEAACDAAQIEAIQKDRLQAKTNAALSVAEGALKQIDQLRSTHALTGTIGVSWHQSVAQQALARIAEVRK